MVAYYSPFNLRTLSDRVLSNSRTKETETDQVTKVGKKKKKEKRKEEKYNSFLYAKPTRVLYVSLLCIFVNTDLLRTYYVVVPGNNSLISNAAKIKKAKISN
jgi:hypothetical protein